MRTLRALLLTATAITAIAPPSHAQSAGDGFLFRVPVGAWTMRAGFDRALANSDIFAFATDQLTLSRSDFGSATVGTSASEWLSLASNCKLACKPCCHD